MAASLVMYYGKSAVPMLYILSLEASEQFTPVLVIGDDLCKFVLPTMKTWAVACEQGHWFRVHTFVNWFAGQNLLSESHHHLIHSKLHNMSELIKS